MRPCLFFHILYWYVYVYVGRVSMKKILLHRLKPEEQDEIFRIVIGDILRALFNEKERVSIGITMRCDVNCYAKTLCRTASLCRNQWTTQTAISVSFGIIMRTLGNYTNSVWIYPRIHKSSLHYSSCYCWYCAQHCDLLCVILAMEKPMSRTELIIKKAAGVNAVRPPNWTLPCLA